MAAALNNSYTGVTAFYLDSGGSYDSTVGDDRAVACGDVPGVGHK